MIPKKKKKFDNSNYSQDDKREQGGYSYQQWMAYTYLGYKESAPQKLTLKKSPSKSEIYDGGTLLATYEENGNMFWLGLPNLTYEIFGRGRDVKKNKKEEFKKINESYFIIEELEDVQIEPTEEELQRAYLNQRGKMKGKIVNRVSKIAGGETNTLNVKVDNSNKNMTPEEIAQWVLDNFKNGFNKYGVILSEWLINGLFESTKEKKRFVLVLNYLIENDNDDYDETFNNFSISQLKSEYSVAIKAAIRKEREEINKLPVQNNGYTVVRIRDESHAKSYINYLHTDPWCITRGAYSNYIDPEAGKAESFYILLKDGYKNIELPVKHKQNAYDDYAKSMIMVSVRQDGSIRTVTSRYNHTQSTGDSFMNDLELSQLIGRSIYKACPPLSSPLDLARDVRIKGLTYLNSENQNKKLNFYGENLYLLDGKEIETDTWGSILKFNRIITIRNDRNDRDSDIIGYMLIQKVLASDEAVTDRDATIDFYYGMDLNLNLIYGPSNKGNIFTTLPKVRKILKGE